MLEERASPESLRNMLRDVSLHPSDFQGLCLPTVPMVLGTKTDRDRASGLGAGEKKSGTGGWRGHIGASTVDSVTYGISRCIVKQFCPPPDTGTMSE